ncbi:hypothetical protein [Pseudodesulfovibrio sp. zrk46]|uniref:hypothetical protein n=1 Tax=Pseudodesulfovibrio sp. zrk46 TaxID=2725288 RepID=UPI0014498F7D|nr:hypothetical protein [Pseudodesulfovibrio sp. zrk46]QJB56456.1 hypothetical protein HFN16_08545 [Pseudodesulfovibrio sp. zrk46]
MSACLASGKNYHLLYVYMKREFASPEMLAAMLPDQDVSGLQEISAILFDAHEPVYPGLTFEQMAAHADGVTTDWDVVFILTARNESNKPLTDEQAKKHLADMREKIMAGEFPVGAPIFDRNGDLKALDKAAPIQMAATGRLN